MNFHHTPPAETKPKKNFLKEFRQLSAKKRITTYACFFLVLMALFTGGAYLNRHFTVRLPAYGGTLTEGFVGTPRFINPVLASTEKDQDLTALIYSGLFKASSTAPGKYVPDLATGYTISEDGRTYTVKLRENAVWQDGVPVTARDVIFTIEKIQDGSIGSPKRVSWLGVTAEKVDDHTVAFHLRDPYGPFIQNLTIGILPEHIWKNKTANDFLWSSNNIHPIGTGPYKIGTIDRDSNGNPHAYTLVAFKNYVHGEPYIKNIKIRFYPTEADLVEALQDHEIDSAAGINTTHLKKLDTNRLTIKTAPLLRVYGVFLNHNQNPIFLDKAIRKALALATNKDEIVSDALDGYGTPLEGPLPPGIPGYAASTGTSSPKEKLQQAKDLLELDGWEINDETQIYERVHDNATQTLAFTLNTVAIPKLEKTARLLKKDWAALGADVTVQVDKIDELNQNVIRPRNYDALLFGQVIGNNPDLYAFWHSSERIDPGLNIALYTNTTADKLLEDARKITNTDERAEKYSEFEETLKEEYPAIFLFTPDFIYLVPKDLHGLRLGPITTASDRFSDVSEWYTKTRTLWKFFSPR